MLIVLDILPLNLILSYHEHNSALTWFSGSVALNATVKHGLTEYINISNKRMMAYNEF